MITKVSSAIVICSPKTWRAWMLALRHTSIYWTNCITMSRTLINLKTFVLEELSMVVFSHLELPTMSRNGKGYTSERTIRMIQTSNKTVVAIDILPHLDLNATHRWQPAVVTWFLERQRFFVELKEEEGTMISWKKLVADTERLSSGSGAHKGLLTTDLLKSDRNTKLVVSSCTDTALETSDSKSNRITGPLEQDTDFSCSEHEHKPKGGSIMDSSLEETTIELDKEVGRRTPIKGNVHRATPTACDSVHTDTSRSEETKQTCVCCSELGLY